MDKTQLHFSPNVVIFTSADFTVTVCSLVLHFFSFTCLQNIKFSCCFSKGVAVLIRFKFVVKFSSAFECYFMLNQKISDGFDTSHHTVVAHLDAGPFSLPCLIQLIIYTTSPTLYRQLFCIIRTTYHNPTDRQTHSTFALLMPE